jgi:hypothetical protein
VEADKKRFQNEMKAFVEADNAAVKGATKTKAKKKSAVTRQGKNAYNFFMEANRGRVIAENPKAKDYNEIVSFAALMHCL